MFASLRVTRLIGAFGFVAMFGMTGSAYAIGTSHDLSTVGDTEVCIYCHTPHNSDSATAPLWNRDATGSTYVPYTSPTIDMTVAAPAGVSLACLSCHDGTLAFNALINAGGADDIGTMPGTAGDPGSRNFGVDLSNQHPISITYDNTADTAFVATPAGLPLYGVGSDQVECGTCHDPHLADGTKLLRVANTNSDLCLTCHVK